MKLPPPPVNIHNFKFLKVSHMSN